MPISRSTAWKAHLAACICNVFPSESFLDITSHHITGAMRVVLRFISQQHHPLHVVPTNSCRSHEGHHRIRKAPCVFPTRSNALITEDVFLPCRAHSIRGIPHVSWNTAASVYIIPTRRRERCYGSRSSLNFVYLSLLSLSLYI